MLLREMHEEPVIEAPEASSVKSLCGFDELMTLKRLGCCCYRRFKMVHRLERRGGSGVNAMCTRFH